VPCGFFIAPFAFGPRPVRILDTMFLMKEYTPALAMLILQSRLDFLQVQNIALGRLTNITTADRKQQQSAIYSDLSTLAVDWSQHLARNSGLN
jgi:hypothetical protein